MKAQGWIVSVYAELLRLYPRHFRARFALEMQVVLDPLSSQAAEADGWALAVLFLRELKDLPLAVL